MFSYDFKVVIFHISHIQGNKVLLDTDIWLLMESWFLLSEPENNHHNI